MPNSSGLFDGFGNLDQIQASDVAKWLKPAPNLIVIEDYIANRILYPQTIPTNISDVTIDLAIVREVLKQSSQNRSTFLNIIMRRIMIPVSFLEYVPDLSSLVWAFIDGLLFDRSRKDWFQDLWTVVLTGDIDEIVGSIILPQFNTSNGLLEIRLSNSASKIRAGSLTVLHCPKNKCQIEYKIADGKILGKSENAVEVYGGKLGIVIDGRLA